MLVALSLALALPSTDARIAAAEARLAALDRQRAAQRAELAAIQTPLALLLAAVQRLALRPATLAFARPGSIDDLIHADALMRALRPAIAIRATAIRRDMARTRRLSTAAAEILAAIGTERSAYEHALNGRLAQLPDIPDAAPANVAGVYRLPVTGTVVSGTGERAEAGSRARGLTVLTAPAAAVAAPAGGRIAYAGGFGGYGEIVILDHGKGWTSVLTGLDHAEAAVGTIVDRGAPIGRMGTRARRITIELRHDGEPVDVAGIAAQ